MLYGQITDKPWVKELKQKIAMKLGLQYLDSNHAALTKEQLHQEEKVESWKAEIEAWYSSKEYLLQCLIQPVMQWNQQSTIIKNPHKDSLKLIKILVKLGVDVNARLHILMFSRKEESNDNCLTILCSALNEYSLNIIKYLVEQGADIKYRNKRGYSPIELALKCNNEYSLDVVNYLIEKGALND